MILFLNLKKDSSLFLSPKMFQATSIGSMECDEKNPTPAIALYGYFSLNKKGDLGA